VDTRRPPVWWEFSVGLVAFFACTSLSRISFGDKHAAAMGHARAILHLQERLGLRVEVPMNQWLAAQDGLAKLAAYHYAAFYVITSIAVLVFLYLRRPAIYRWGRRSCLLLNVLAAGCFALYPVAPPRFIPELDIVDTVQRERIWGTWGSPVGDSVNQLAALPSLHFALVLWVLVMLMMATRSVVLITLAALDVAVTAVVVVATGNHYPFDLLAGAILVAICVPLTRPAAPGRPRRRPGGWVGRLTDALRVRAILLPDPGATDPRAAG
jgi:diacylglycerol O-acyltransferase